MELVLGIDEAGRGCVLGPLVIAGYLINENQLEKLKDIGVKDSKLLSASERSEILQEIKKTAIAHKVIKIMPDEIDQSLSKMSLNDLEALKMTEIINAFPEANKVIIDCPDANVLKFKGFIYNYIKNKALHENIIAEHKADMNHVVVGAASIFAKVHRDNEIERLKAELKQNIGSGYPSDPLTKQFLEENWDKHDDIFRKSWQTWKDMKTKKLQKNLFEF